MVPRGSGELSDENAVGGRSMILIHLDRIEHAYGNSKSARGSRGQAMDSGLQWSCQHGDRTEDLTFHRAERYDLLGVNERHDG